MHGGTAYAPIRLPLAQLAAALTGVCAAIGALGAAAGWALPSAIPTDGLWPALAVLLPAAAGVLFLSLWGPRPAFTWASIVLAGSALRMGLSILIAFVIFRATGPDRLFFWSVFLVASMAVLAAEVAIVAAALRPGQAANPATSPELARA